jgi:hypothetical protein
MQLVVEALRLRLRLLDHLGQQLLDRLVGNLRARAVAMSVVLVGRARAA